MTGAAPASSRRDYAVSLDAGCGFGGPLLAACFAPDGSIVERIEA